MTFLLCDPAGTSMMSRMNGKKTHTHTDRPGRTHPLLLRHRALRVAFHAPRISRSPGEIFGGGTAVPAGGGDLAAITRASGSGRGQYPQQTGGAIDKAGRASALSGLRSGVCTTLTISREGRIRGNPPPTHFAIRGE